MQVWVSFAWILAISAIFGVIFGNYPLQQVDNQIPLLISASYATFSRLVWSVALSWIIFACVHGYGGPINWFLSLAAWQPLVSMSYSLYIVHPLVQLVLKSSIRSPAYFNDLNVVSIFLFRCFFF